MPRGPIYLGVAIGAVTALGILLLVLLKRH